MNDLRECILVVDDDYLIADTWSMIIEDMGLETCGIAASGEVAIDMAKAHRPRLVLMDVRLQGDLDGVDAAMAIHDQIGSEVIFITGSQEPVTAARMEARHPAAVLLKPVTVQRLESAVRTVMTT